MEQPLTVRNQANPIEDVGQRIRDIVNCFEGNEGYRDITRCLVVLQNFGNGVPTHFWERKRSRDELEEENEECEYGQYGHAEKYIIARLEHYLGRDNQAVDSMPNNQAVDSMPNNQAVDNMPNNQAVDSMPNNQAVDSMPNNQAVDNMPNNQAVDSMPNNQAVDSMPNNQAVDNMPNNQAVDSMPNNQAVDSMPNNQAVDNMPNNQAVDSMPNNQAVDNMPNVGAMNININNPQVTVYSNYSPCKTARNDHPSCSMRLLRFLNAQQHRNVQIEFRCIYRYIEYGTEDVDREDKRRISEHLQIFDAANDLGVLRIRLNEMINEMINDNNEGLTNEDELRLRNIVAEMAVIPTFTR